MTTNHKATPEQWAMLEERSAPEYDNTILELRARVEALEAGATCPHIATSDEGTSYCRLAEQRPGPASALSPAARAVLDAFVGDPTERDELEDDRWYLAAALRAAADRVEHHWDGKECVDYLCAIAAELESKP